MIDYYQMLGLQPTCTEDEVKKAYRKLASLYHPDMHITSNNHKSGNRKEEEEQQQQQNNRIDMFYQVQEAYQVLSDIHSRSEYDKERIENMTKDSVINAEIIPIEELTIIHDNEESNNTIISYEKACRCGGIFEISQEELHEGYTTIQCTGCSLYIDIDQTKELS